MWNTSEGVRVVGDDEWLVIRMGAARLWAEVKDADGRDEPVTTGIKQFDALTFEQQAWSLYTCLRALREIEVPVPDLTASCEATIGALFVAVAAVVGDSPGESGLRAAIVAAAQVEQVDRPTDEVDWKVCIDCCAERILWDCDFDMDDLADLPPEVGGQTKTVFGISDDYFNVAAHEPTRAELADAVSYLNAI